MNAPVARPLPQAARWQRSVVPFDDLLTAAARQAHPTVAWWWGGRAMEGTFGAFCYLCDRHVATWARAWPMTVAACTAIIGHRAAHQAAAQFHIGPIADVKSTPAEAAPAGSQQ